MDVNDAVDGGTSPARPVTGFQPDEVLAQDRLQTTIEPSSPAANTVEPTPLMDVSGGIA
jgi:hypothetical protein